MEVWIPSQSIEIAKIHLGPLITGDKYSLATISYTDGILQLSDFTVITPQMTVSSYDAATGRLQFDLAEHPAFATKMAAIQTYIISTLFLHQKAYFGPISMYSYEDIENMMQYLVYKNRLTIYTGINRAPPVHSAAAPCASLGPGATVRCVIHIRGVSCMWNYMAGMPRLRFQHSVKAIYCSDGVQGA
jgi:hypothetical protein